jgi:hypothetical protein
MKGRGAIRGRWFDLVWWRLRGKDRVEQGNERKRRGDGLVRSGPEG